MKFNAYQTLRISLAAAVMLLLFAEFGFPAHHHAVRRGKLKHHTSIQYRHRATGTTHRHHKVTKASKVSSHRSTHRAQSSVPESTTYGRVMAGKLDVRKDGHVIAEVDESHRFMILSRKGNDFKVKLSSGRIGYVNADYVSIEETRKPEPISDRYAYRPDVVRVACTYRGARYRSGGMSSRGFDCSGFVKYVYSTQGVKLPHSSRAQYGCGTPVSKSELRPGDMVFFGGTYRSGISHVGLYIGDGRFIHASTHRAGVRIDELNADYYRRRYAGARRVRQ